MWLSPQWITKLCVYMWPSWNITQPKRNPPTLIDSILLESNFRSPLPQREASVRNDQTHTHPSRNSAWHSWLCGFSLPPWGQIESEGSQQYIPHPLKTSALLKGAFRRQRPMCVKCVMCVREPWRKKPPAVQHTSLSLYRSSRCSPVDRGSPHTHMFKYFRGRRRAKVLATTS